MAIIRWDPFRDLVNLQEKMNRLFEDSLGSRNEMLYRGSWVPPVDVYECDGKIFIKAEIPGVESDDIAVEVKENVVTIRGERKLDEELRKENYHRIERSYGVFQRSFALPGEVEESEVNAVFCDGVLEVILPRPPDHQPRKIEVKVS